MASSKETTAFKIQVSREEEENEKFFMDAFVAVDYHIFWYGGAMPVLGIDRVDRKGQQAG